MYSVSAELWATMLCLLFLQFGILAPERNSNSVTEFSVRFRLRPIKIIMALKGFIVVSMIIIRKSSAYLGGSKERALLLSNDLSTDSLGTESESWLHKLYQASLC